MELNKKETLPALLKLSPFFLFFTLLTSLASDNIFFWDTVVQGAMHASFYFDSNFSQILLPNAIDNGHIPAYGVYLALTWKVFGKNLLVSHFSTLPFVFGIIWQAFVLLKKYICPKYVYFALGLFLVNTSLLSQSTLMTPDIPLAFFFLLGINSVLNYKKTFLSIAIAGLFLMSMRGMMVAVAILISDVITNVKFDNFKSVFLQLAKKSFAYLPALFIFLSYNLYHYYTKGWIGYHEDWPWADLFQRVGPKGFFYNLGILVWRILDFGQVFLWLAAAIIFFRNFKHLVHDKKIIQLALMFFLVLISLSITITLYKNLNGHRYLLPAYFIFSVLSSYLVFEKISSEKIKYIVFSVLLVGLLTGNLWIYPDKIAKGWDSTLAHLPYYQLRKEMLSYMEQEHIKIEDVASGFPNLAEQRFLALNNDRRKHKPKNLSINKYVLYSNIYNDFEDEELAQLKSDFVLLKEYKNAGVFMRLYKKSLD